MDDLPSGRLMLVAQHPRLDSLLLEQLSATVEVPAHSSAGAVLASPDLGELSLLLCKSRRDFTAGRGLLIGRSYRVGSPTPQQRRSSRVRVVWRGADGRPAAAEHELEQESASPPPQSFAICNLPVDAELAIQLFDGSDSTDLTVARIPRSGVLSQNLVLGMRTTDSLHVVRIALSLLDPNGNPVRDARVEGSSALRFARSDAFGRVLLSTNSVGTQTVSIRAIGYVPRTIVIDDVTISGTVRLVQLTPLPTQLERVAVVAPLSYAGFRQRMASARGVFMDSTAVNDRRALTFASLVERLPGVVSLSDREFGPRFFVKSGRQQCEPTVFVNGLELAGRTRNLDGLVDIAAVAGVEVYSVAAEVPMQFLADGLCGAVMIWTRRR